MHRLNAKILRDTEGSMATEHDGEWCMNQIGKTLFSGGIAIGVVDSWRQNHRYWQLGIRESGGGRRWPDSHQLVEPPDGGLKYADWLEVPERNRKLSEGPTVESTASSINSENLTVGDQMDCLLYTSDAADE